MNGGRECEQKKETGDTEKASTRQLMGIDDITGHSLVTPRRAGIFMIKPTNISVLSDSSIGARIYALMNVLKGISDIEILCLNSRENFEDNKGYLKARMDTEQNLSSATAGTGYDFLDRMQVQMATAREFLIIIRLRGEKKDVQPYLSASKEPQGSGLHCAQSR